MYEKTKQLLSKLSGKSVDLACCKYIYFQGFSSGKCLYFKSFPFHHHFYPLNVKTATNGKNCLRGELNFFLSSFFLALLLCDFPTRLGIRVDTRVSFVQNSRYFQAKQVSYFAIKFSLFREISCFAKLPVTKHLTSKTNRNCNVE